MLFRQAFLDGIAAGDVTLAFRRWRRPSVKAGGRLRTPVGELAIEKVESILRSDIRARDARAAGYASLEELLAELDERADGDWYRIQFHLADPDTRIALREAAKLTANDFAEIAAQLARLDAASKVGPWTKRVLSLIESHPEVRAAQLTQSSGLTKEWLKLNVRKLKNLGLTESLQAGYRLSPRGRAVLKRLRQQRCKQT